MLHFHATIPTHWCLKSEIPQEYLRKNPLGACLEGKEGIPA